MDDDELARLLAEVGAPLDPEAPPPAPPPAAGGRPPRARAADITTANIVQNKRKRDRAASDASEGA